MSPLALKCGQRLSITQVRFCFIQMNVFSIKCAVCTIKSLKYMKSHSMHSHKPFETQGIQIILLTTQNTLNVFKQAFQNSTLANNHLQNSNYLKTSQLCFQTFKSDPLSSEQFQTLQISFSTLRILKFNTLEL